VTPTVVERVLTPRGELALRRDGEHFEVISNGVFLMDTRDGRSERLLVRAALDAHANPRRLLIGGLGVGFSLTEAVTDMRLAHITVVEIEPTLVDWYARQLGGTAHHDPRVTVVVGDVAERTETYDVICLDVDNGPDWTVTETNRDLYDAAGTSALVGRLDHGGVLAVWSAHEVPSYEVILRQQFRSIRVLTVDVPRGEPDVVYVASGSTCST
jgi:spermidine synthase